MQRFHVTYDTVTEESARDGDVSDRGFVTADGSLESMLDSPCGPAFVPIKAAHALRLKDAVDLLGCLEDGDGYSYYESDGRHDYADGAETRFAFHLPDNASAASVDRVRRLLVSRGLLRHVPSRTWTRAA